LLAEKLFPMGAHEPGSIALPPRSLSMLYDSDLLMLRHKGVAMVRIPMAHHFVEASAVAKEYDNGSRVLASSRPLRVCKVASLPPCGAKDALEEG